MQIFLCEHVDDGKSQGPYIYMQKGIGAPHYCIRVNRKAYVFVIPQKFVPKWFDEDGKIRFLGDLKSVDVLTTTDKNILSDKLAVSTLASETKANLWERILQRELRTYKLDVSLMLKRIEAGERHYVDIEV